MSRCTLIRTKEALDNFIARDVYSVILYVQSNDFASAQMQGYILRKSRAYWFVEFAIVNINDYDSDIVRVSHTPTIKAYRKKNILFTIVGTDYKFLSAALVSLSHCGGAALSARTDYQRR